MNKDIYYVKQYFNILTKIIKIQKELNINSSMIKAHYINYAIYNYLTEDNTIKYENLFQYNNFSKDFKKTEEYLMSLIETIGDENYKVKINKILEELNLLIVAYELEC